MWKEYKETFENVHASQRLKTEVLNVKREENEKTRRRIPAAALIAAVLAVALAGTALAAEIINRVTAELIDPDETGISADGYNLSAYFDPLPLESLSEEALERFADGDADYISRKEGIDADYVTWYFASWAEAEAFLGLDLGRNRLLEQHPEIIFPDSDHWACVSGGAVIDVGGTMTPAAITLSSKYKIEDCLVYVQADLEVDLPEAEAFAGRPLGQWEDSLWTAEDAYPVKDVQFTLEEYTTTSGLDTILVSCDGTRFVGGEQDLQVTTAHFVKGCAKYLIHCEGPDHETETAVLKTILDAYE